MAALPEERGTRRKRVFRACESCRSMKSKCNGARPACARCTGYGYKCVYAVSGKKGFKLHRLGATSHDDGIAACCTLATALRSAVGDYDKLIRGVLPQLPEPGRPGLLDALRSLDERVCNALREASCRDESLPPLHPAVKQMAATPRSLSRIPPPRPAERYLGEVSDVRFFHLVDRALGDTGAADHSTEIEAVESYEQDEPSPESVAAHGAIVEPSGAEAAQRYLDIYFSTIHIAYPFIPRALFMKTYENYLASGKKERCGDAWLATLYIIFAIGAYYGSVSGSTGDLLHEQYYHHALALSNVDTLERSLDEVSFLLAQCFYLLAVCRTDKCWTTLGLAVRIAQSIGLHVDIEPPQPGGGGQARPKAEARRRVWYSIYVLDRLLALQLGRPPAIHDDDCHLQLPSRLGDADIDWDGTNLIPPQDPASPAVGDYFVSVIALSKIIGYVLRDLYSPRCKTDVAGWLPSTKALDGQLLEWRRTLPRQLRFDFGHAFETSLAFKRQRNMLAIKFHHLRALVHRPYLCLPLLKHMDGAVASSLQGDTHLLDQYEKTCIFEAQETAHLLHNVVNKEDLVHDFPWWQMISCLVCASSILVVASAFARRAGFSEGSAVDVAALEDDAETCLTVFEALSPNSGGARIARDMMRRLKARGSAWRNAHQDHSGLLGGSPSRNNNVFKANVLHPSAALHKDQASEQSSTALPTPFQGDAGPLSNFLPAAYDGGGSSPQEWPLEILDSMAWSTQFFDAVDGSVQPEAYGL
ncbi:Transcription factor [Niveomyces insectorum RCEF 264]|uniref:Transcription factor n=1 Tax=Niveomyces insectorum RCEF 264 TaxID=1081102 RepID=A0A167WFI8_9HYPO|nr:Transcription factor [Niveomyces insectorum RCEF 264]